jgi:hypothetical protein
VKSEAVISILSVSALLGSSSSSNTAVLSCCMSSARQHQTARDISMLGDSDVGRLMENIIFSPTKLSPRISGDPCWNTVGKS